MAIGDPGSADKNAGTSPGPSVRDPQWDDMVLVGRIARTHGIRGQVIITPDTDFVEERFAAGSTLWTRSGALRVTSTRVQNGRPVVGFEGCSTLDHAARLAGLELRVPEEMLRPLAPGSYYQHQLVGATVETTAGAEVGRVTRVSGGAAGSLLIVEGTRGEILIPMVEGICLEVDIDAKRIRIDPPAGLLELNEK
jgi:16S rRNA processing protein RimM